jgi:hypothetical protein
MGKAVAHILTGICLFLAAPVLAADTTGADDSLVIAVVRSDGGEVAPTGPTTHYRFTVAKDGSWEFVPQKGTPKKGKLSADDLSKWVKEIEDGGLYKVKSDPYRPATDASFMGIAVRSKGKKTRVVIALEEKLSQGIEKKIVELAKPGQ